MSKPTKSSRSAQDSILLVIREEETISSSQMEASNTSLEDQHELFSSAWEAISNELVKLRDAGISDEEIFNFGKTVINHYDPLEKKRLKEMSDKQDALWKEANDL